MARSARNAGQYHGSLCSPELEQSLTAPEGRGSGARARARLVRNYIEYLGVERAALVHLGWRCSLRSLAFIFKDKEKEGRQQAEGRKEARKRKGTA